MSTQFNYLGCLEEDALLIGHKYIICIFGDNKELVNIHNPLFIFINSICIVITSLYHLYADDRQIYSHSIEVTCPNVYLVGINSVLLAVTK